MDLNVIESRARMQLELKCTNACSPEINYEAAHKPVEVAKIIKFTQGSF